MSSKVVRRGSQRRAQLGPNWETWPVEHLLAFRDELAAMCAQVKGIKVRYRNDPVAFAHDCIDWRGESLTAYQQEILAELPVRRRVAVRGPHGLGKAQPYDLFIDTPTGERPFGKLNVGDLVFGSDGKPTKILGIYERGTMEVFRVVFNDGSSTECTADHLWTVRKFTWGSRTDVPEWVTMPLSELVERGLRRSNGNGATARKWDIPQSQPLEYSLSWVPVDPYLLGAWLGDGTGRSGNISTNDMEIGRRIEQGGNQIRRFQQRTVGEIRVTGLFAILRRMGLLGLKSREKYIPNVYLYNSVDIRKELLRGLLDTDGSVEKTGVLTFCSTSKYLTKQVAWLAQSLGGLARIKARKNKFGPFWTVILTLPFDRWFYVERKQKRLKPISQQRYLSRWIDKIEPIGEKQVRCIQVDAPDGLYVANAGILTHNTCIASIALLHFALTHDGDDWKVPTTASAWRQLTDFFWPEVHKWAARLKWDTLQRVAFTQFELQSQLLKLNTGRAFAMASSEDELTEGAHASHLLYILDEAKVIPAGRWDAAEGALATGDAYALAISTPGEPQGRFYDIHTRKPGYEDWWVRHVTLDECIAAGRITREFADQRARQWGENSAVYQNRILGEFCESSEDCVVPLAWVEAANERWLQRVRMEPNWNWIAGAKTGTWPRWQWAHESLATPVTHLGLDIARSDTGDKTVIARRQADTITQLDRYAIADTQPIVGYASNLLERWTTASAIVDVIGIGSGPYDQLRERFPRRATPFNASESSDLKDRSGELQFANKRAAAWWHFRELLDPAFGSTIALPPDDLLTGDLTAPRRGRMTSSGKLTIESKDDIRKRLGRSTDDGDAVVMAFFPEPPPPADDPAYSISYVTY